MIQCAAQLISCLDTTDPGVGGTSWGEKCGSKLPLYPRAGMVKACTAVFVLGRFLGVRIIFQSRENDLRAETDKTRLAAPNLLCSGSSRTADNKSKNDEEIATKTFVNGQSGEFGPFSR